MASFNSLHPLPRLSRSPSIAAGILGRLAIAMALTGMAFAPGQARAESVFLQVPSGARQPLTASAHLDFRITIEPTLALDSRQPPAVLMVAGGGDAVVRPRWSPRRGSTPQLHQLEPVADSSAMRWTCTEP